MFIIYKSKLCLRPKNVRTHKKENWTHGAVFTFWIFGSWKSTLLFYIPRNVGYKGPAFYSLIWLIFRAVYLVSNFICHLQICRLLALYSYSNFYTRPGGVICINWDINMLFRDGGFYIYYHCAQYLYLIQSLDKCSEYSSR